MPNMTGAFRQRRGRLKDFCVFPVIDVMRNGGVTFARCCRDCVFHGGIEARPDPVIIGDKWIHVPRLRLIAALIFGNVPMFC
jgi:hypothetical protein